MQYFQPRYKFALGVSLAIFATGCAAQIGGGIPSEPKTNDLKIVTHEKVVPEGAIPTVVVHIDPKTGEFMSPADVPPAGQIPQPLAGAAAAPLPELQQILSPVPGGGVMIELDERFRIPLTATIEIGGNVRIEHQASPSNE